MSVNVEDICRNEQVYKHNRFSRYSSYNACRRELFSDLTTWVYVNFIEKFDSKLTESTVFSITKNNLLIFMGIILLFIVTTKKHVVWVKFSVLSVRGSCMYQYIKTTVL